MGPEEKHLLPNLVSLLWLKNLWRTYKGRVRFAAMIAQFAVEETLLQRTQMQEENTFWKFGSKVVEKNWLFNVSSEVLSKHCCFTAKWVLWTMKSGAFQSYWVSSTFKVTLLHHSYLSTVIGEPFMTARWVWHPFGGKKKRILQHFYLCTKFQSGLR